MAGTDTTKTSATAPGPRIVLVRPQLGENIGAAARAMLNNALDDMALVAPREAWPNEAAVKMASGADAVLDKAQVFDDVETAVADLTRVYATTARPRDMTQRVLTPRAAVAELRAHVAAGEAVGVLFGPERSGLTNDDLVQAEAVIRVPLNPAYASLNLAQAVLLVAYEWFQAGDATPEAVLETHDSRPAEKAELEGFFARLIAGLESGGFFRSPGLKPVMIRNLRALFQRATPTEQEVRTLHGVVSSLTGSWRGTAERRRAAQDDTVDS